MIRVRYADVRPLAEESLFSAGLGEVSPYRREKIKSIRSQMDRCRSLAAGLLLKQEIINAGISYEQVKVVLGEWGKPTLILESGVGNGGWLDDRPAEGFCYSVSHSGDYAAVAAATFPVGLDIQCADRVRRPESLARRILTAREAADWAKNPSADRLTRLWTRKEATVKADGRGLSADFRKVETSGDWGEKHILSCEPRPGLWLSLCCEALTLGAGGERVSIEEAKISGPEGLWDDGCRQDGCRQRGDKTLCTMN